MSFAFSVPPAARPQFDSYANPVVSSVTVYNTSFILPGFQICMPAPYDPSAPVANTIYADPRLRYVNRPAHDHASEQRI